MYIVVVFSCVLRLELAKFSVSVVTVQPGDFSKATNLLNSHHRCSTAPANTCTWHLVLCAGT